MPDFLRELLERECQQRRQNRIERLLKAIASAAGEELGGAGSEATAGEGGAAVAGSVERGLPGSPGERAGVRPAGLGEDARAVRGGPGTGALGSADAVHDDGLLVQELLTAKRDLTLKACLKRLSQWEALILDDLGYVQQSREEMEVLFTLLAERYERGSVCLTSNLPFSKWEQIFKDPMTTAAAIDRLVHHSVIVELNGPSYRAEAAKRAKSNGGREA